MSQTERVFELRPHHVAINVPDIDAAIAWYGDVLGFEVEKRNFIRGAPGQNALIKNRDFRLELFQHEKITPRAEDASPSPPGTEMIGFRQLAFTVDDLRGFSDSLRRKKVDITRERPDGTVLFIRDVAGNVIEFMSPG